LEIQGFCHHRTICEKYFGNYIYLKNTTNFTTNLAVMDLPNVCFCQDQKFKMEVIAGQDFIIGLGGLAN
jgi:hypothetical protein